MKKASMLFCLVFALAQVFGQTTTKKTELNAFSAEKEKEFKARKDLALEFANKNNLPILINNEEVLMELMYIDRLGQPQYYITHNTNAASTSSTDKVHPGGICGYSLDGSGMTVHEWDGGGVLTTHQEYGGRAVQGDAATGTHYHSTHVAGTLIASGVSGNAKGMAPAAFLRAFEWNNDEAEMAYEAANNNALVSNHSYGYGRGWESNGTSWAWYGNTSVSTEEDYLFGFYDSQAQSWDNIAYNAPYYLIVKSAGNDRDDGPGSGTYPDDGPYDCIAHAGVSKNILTVGSVADIPGGYTQPSDVVMTYYSSWGPADDGRIKPDIVSNGAGLYSTDNGSNTDYTTLSGTSMASPSTAGSVLLLQQHYEDITGSGNYMRAATLKAVIIHTADEAGTSDGPDYSFGWGLLNTMKAADLITDDASINTIEENTLTEGDSYQRTVKALGNEPLKVTVSWTDAPGTPAVASLDPVDPMLVNDLDLRITSVSNTYYPWKLDPSDPSAAATRAGENDVDNVEVVVVDNPVAGAEYTITIDHDGTLSGGLQAFSVVVSGIEPLEPIPPVADFTASTNSVTTGGLVNFTDQSLNCPSNWSWSFSPSTVTYMNGTCETSRNPQVCFDAPGNYDVTLMAENAFGSDTEIKATYINVSDPEPVTLPWVEGFEEFSGTATFVENTTCIAGMPEWSYDKTAGGRLRIGAGPNFTYSGNYSATLDASPAGTLSENNLIATMNLSNYTSCSELELSFFYMHHGEEMNSNDRVWIRGTDNDPWIEVYDLYANKGSAGVWKSVVQIDVDQALAANGQVPGTTFQIRFGQEDDYPASTITGSDGFTFDDIALREMSPSAYIISDFPYEQSWESGEGLWVQSGDDDFDWSLHSGGTASATTGPSAAHDGSSYMYTESSSPRLNGDEAYLEASFDFSALQDPSLSFFYHMYGSTMGTLYVDVFDGTNWTPGVWTASGQLQTSETDPYEQAIVNLSAWGGLENVMIRFRGSVGNGSSTVYYSDMAIDMIEVDGNASPQPPVADFTANQTNIQEGSSVQFTGLCQNNPTTYSWTFEGGLPANSTQQDPQVSYATAGVYTVTLEVSNAQGSDTEVKTAYITVTQPPVLPVADFVADNTSITEGDNVQFTDLSNNTTSWSWNFPGGNPATSTDQHPSVNYPSPGVYTVELTATNADGSDTETKVDYISVDGLPSPPVADFTANSTSIAEGDAVAFSDLSTNATSWSWTFQGGDPATSSDQNPTVTYPAPGVYTVELTVTNADGSDTETKLDYITVAEVLYPPVADFTANNTSIQEGETVQYSDLSTNNPTSWNWTFNGANISGSTAQNPSVTYPVAGTYTVSMEAANADGSDIETKTSYITVNPALSQTQLVFSNFESGWGLWTDGGNDCQLHTSGTFAWGGSNAANIQDDSGIPASFFLTNGIDVHTPAYVQIDVEFYFVAMGMKNRNDKFYVEYYDGSSWQVVATYASTIDFETGNYYKAIVSIHEVNYNFPTNMKIRFRNDAKKDDKDVFIDDITITAANQTVPVNPGLTLMLKSTPLSSAVQDNDRLSIMLYPNPVVDNLHIKASHDTNARVFIYNAAGQQMYYGSDLFNHRMVNVSSFDNGIYIVKVVSDEQVLTKRFLKL